VEPPPQSHSDGLEDEFPDDVRMILEGCSACLWAMYFLRFSARRETVWYEQKDLATPLVIELEHPHQ